MNIDEIIEIGKELYKFKRQRKSAISDGEQLLFNACHALQQLEAKNKKIKIALKEITQIHIWGCDKKQQGDYGCNLMQDIAEQALEQ